jgi:hypothetical protein
MRPRARKVGHSPPCASNYLSKGTKHAAQSNPQCGWKPLYQSTIRGWENFNSDPVRPRRRRRRTELVKLCSQPLRSARRCRLSARRCRLRGVAGGAWLSDVEIGRFADGLHRVGYTRPFERDACGCLRVRSPVDFRHRACVLPRIGGGLPACSTPRPCTESRARSAVSLDLPWTVPQIFSPTSPVM